MNLKELKGDGPLKIVSSKPTAAITPPKEKKGHNLINEFSVGFAKGGLSTVTGLGQIGQSVLRNTAGRVVNAAQGKGFTPTPASTDFYAKTKEFLTPENTAQKVGFGTEQFAEFFLPAAKLARAEQGVNLITKGMTALPGATSRIGLKSAIQGLGAGAVSFAQSGCDFKKAAETAALAGATRGAFAVIGEGARALKIPER